MGQRAVDTSTCWEVWMVPGLFALQRGTTLLVARGSYCHPYANLDMRVPPLLDTASSTHSQGSSQRALMLPLSGTLRRPASGSCSQRCAHRAAARPWSYLKTPSSTSGAWV